MQGYGFSASGVSKSFSFVDTVSGTIITGDDEPAEKTEDTPLENEAESEE